jgi:uncharacterized protein (DUF1697 family)
MAEAAGALEAAGLTGVTSVLASGNLIFRSDRPRSELRVFLERTLSEHYQGGVDLFVKNTDEVSAILSSVPFGEAAGSHIYAFVCEPGFETVLFDEFEKITPADGEDAKMSGGLFYWRCPKGATLDSGFSRVLGRKNMRDKFTSRNIGTIAKVYAKMNK